jgi:hypothetical protein
MQGTDRIYEEPSQLSKWLIAGLSVAVVVMAGWLAVKIAVSPPSQPVPASTRGLADAAAGPPAARSDGTVPAGPDARQETPSTTSVFDWPAEFASTRPPAPPMPHTVLQLAPELPATRDVGQPPWPAAAPAGPEPRDRSVAPQTEATEAMVDILAPPSRGTAAKEAAAAQRPAPRRQKPVRQPMPLQPPPPADGDGSQ